MSNTDIASVKVTRTRTFTGDSSWRSTDLNNNNLFSPTDDHQVSYDDDDDDTNNIMRISPEQQTNTPSNLSPGNVCLLNLLMF